MILNILTVIAIVAILAILIYVSSKKVDDKSYHVTDDCTVLVLNNRENVNSGCCGSCHFVPRSSVCPVDNEGGLKCFKKDKEVGKDSNHIWEVVN